MNRRAICSLLVAFATVTLAVSCSSTDSADPPTEAEQVEAALDGLTQGARQPQQTVDVPASAPGPTSLLANNVAGVQRLKTLENEDCGPGGTLDVYAVTGDADTVWRRMLRSSDGDLRQASTEADGQRIRYLRQSGFDYDTEAALSEGSHGTVLALRTCS